MKLVLPLIGLFLLIGMTAPTFGRRAYSQLVGGIVVIVVVFYLLWAL